MKKISGSLLILLVFLVCCDEDNAKIPQAPKEIDLTNSFYYEINLDDRRNDTFKVRMFVDDLNASNAVIQFPATVPGTYDIFDIGRFVVNFKAYSENHDELPVTHPSTNQ